MNPMEFPIQLFERLYTGIAPQEPEPSSQFIDLSDEDNPLVASPALNLHYILQNLGHLPQYSAFLGVCSDGVPFFIDLADPTPGSVLILGQSRCGKTHLLKTLLRSTGELNSSDLVNFFVISNNAHEMRSLSNYPHCQGIYSHFHRETVKIILGLSALAEQRRNGRERGPAIILAIDDLTALTRENMDYELFVHFKWLLRFGPSAWIWPVVTLNENNLMEIDEQLLSGFNTKLYSPPGTGQFELTNEKLSRQFLPYWQAQSDKEFIQFAVPSL